MKKRDKRKKAKKQAAAAAALATAAAKPVSKALVLDGHVISKGDDRVVYGWFSVVSTADDRPIVDLQGDVIFPEDIEKACWDFVAEYRQGGEMHTGRAPNQLVAAFPFTPQTKKALGIPEGAIPSGLAGAFRVPAATFAKVKEGDRLMFSIEGEADREPIEVGA